MALNDQFEEQPSLKLFPIPTPAPKAKAEVEAEIETESEVEVEAEIEAEAEPLYVEPDRLEAKWVLCENCETMLYAKLLARDLRVCRECAYHLEMNSTERIDMLIDSGTWQPMDDTLLSQDILEFVDEETYPERLEENQERTGLSDAVQTGTGTLHGTPVALGVMDFQFMAGSMGSVVGEKITRLTEYATRHQMPLIIVCASGGARMQEGTLSLMQMAKIACAFEARQVQDQNTLLYISILTCPTTGGVTASFGMLGDIIIAEPRAYIAFAGKRVIEEILHQEVPDGSQIAEVLSEHGLIDLIIPRALLKGSLGELFELYKSAPLI